MDITAKGLTPVKQENNSIDFVTGDGEIIFILNTPYMYDSADDFSYDIDIEVQETDDGFRIIFTPDSRWLNSEKRVYPIVIDPNIYSPQSIYNAHDVYVYEGGANPGGEGDRMHVGIRSVN